MRFRVSIALGLALLAGGLVAALTALRAGDSTAPAPAPAAGDPRVERLAADLAELRVELDRERMRRAVLEAEVEDLRGLLGDLSGSEEDIAAADPGGIPPAGDPTGGFDRELDIDVGALDDERLLAAGFSPAEVRAARERMSELAMARLYLVDRASREGWRHSREFREERAGLRDEWAGLRDEFGEDLYDWVLYSTGRANRVAVREVIDGSPASDAGLLSGDVILRYGESRVFDPRQLRDGTLAGEAGEPTPVEIERDGQTLRVWVPRGPLGVHLAPVKAEPGPHAG